MFHPDGPTFFELARQALSSTERGYDLLAEKFDVTPFRTPPIVLQTAAQEIQRLGRFGRALDICCGTGAAMEMLHPLCNETVVGVDFSQGMLNRARKNLDRLMPPPTFDLLRQNVLELNFAPEFDLAVSFSAFGHILTSEQNQFVSGIARALKPGGYFVFATGCKPGIWSRDYWMCRGFNAAMRVRNCVIRPPFVMYYLTFLWPDVVPLLERHGLRVVSPIDQSRNGHRLIIVIAEKK